MIELLRPTEKPRCGVCGFRHRFDTTEGRSRFTAVACVNTLRPKLKQAYINLLLAIPMALFAGGVIGFLWGKVL